MYWAENPFSREKSTFLLWKSIFKGKKYFFTLKMHFQENTGMYCAENAFSKKYREVLARKWIFREIQGCIALKTHFLEKSWPFSIINREQNRKTRKNGKEERARSSAG
jgi:hypothetical protein